LTDILESNEDLVRIAGRWFPRSLLVDVNAGHLNLAEAVLEMENGGPLTTPAFLEQIELPTDVNSKLVEFSLNLALQEDDRFDEVGPAGETLWFLKRLEPDSVKEPPLELGAPQFTLDEAAVQPYLQQMGAYICDELEPEMCPSDEEDETDPGEVTISLIYPHWHAGTLPLSSALKKLFPTAHEAPRVQFNFIDADTNQSFQGWVVRPFKYVFGLHDWYKKNGVIPGSLVHVRRGPNPGEVIVRVDHRKQSREWLRTILVGTDGGIVFAMLKQTISTSSDDRSTIFIPEVELIEKLWSQPNRNKVPLELLLKNLIRELAKLNSQGNVHLEELYSATNILRRCPPGVILSVLINVPWVKHLGDLYFRLNENMDEE
jgi:hypothetical protein